jgi:acid phosphatase family membrane protein YuiD
LTIITIRDAVGFRWHLQEHARALNMIARELHPKNKKMLPPIEEQLGHTIPQVLVGTVIGVLTVWVMDIAFLLIVS